MSDKTLMMIALPIGLSITFYFWYVIIKDIFFSPNSSSEIEKAESIERKGVEISDSGRLVIAVIVIAALIVGISMLPGGSGGAIYDEDSYRTSGRR